MSLNARALTSATAKYPATDGERLIHAAMAGGGPEDHERRRQWPGVGVQIPNQRRGAHRDDNASAHTPVGAVEIELGTEVRLSGSDPLKQVARLTNSRNSVRPIASIISHA